MKKARIHANMFGYGTKRPDPKDVTLITHVANKHGAGFIQFNEPGYEYAFWFTHVKPYPHNKSIANQVLNELLCEGIDLEIKWVIRRPDFDNTLAYQFFNTNVLPTLQASWVKDRLEDMIGRHGRDSYTVRFWLTHKFGFKFPYRHFERKIKMDPKERLDVAVDDADEILKKLEEYDASFILPSNRKEFRKWLIDKLDTIMAEMEDEDEDE